MCSVIHMKQWIVSSFMLAFIQVRTKCTLECRNLRRMVKYLLTDCIQHKYRVG